MTQHIFKLAVRWSDGTVHGYIGKGVSLDLAENDAYRQVIRESGTRSMGFAIRQSADVYTDAFTADEREDIKRDWDLAENGIMGGFINYGYGYGGYP